MKQILKMSPQAFQCDLPQVLKAQLCYPKMYTNIEITVRFWVKLEQFYCIHHLSFLNSIFQILQAVSSEFLLVPTKSIR